MAVAILGLVLGAKPKGWLAVSGALLIFGVAILIGGGMSWLIQVKFLPEDRANPNPRDVGVLKRHAMRGMKEGQTLTAVGASSLGLALIALILHVVGD